MSSFSINTRNQTLNFKLRRIYRINMIKLKESYILVYGQHAITFHQAQCRNFI